MTLRSRPVLDRKHRPRWQDELRTQQLTIIGFAIAIAIALGIFGAAAWNGYWESHLRPVAAVAGTTYLRSDLADRQRILTAETFAEAREIASQMIGAPEQPVGPRDQLLQQQLDSLEVRLSGIETAATESLVDSAVLAAAAGEFGVEVTDEELDAGVAERLTLPDRVRVRLLLVEALPEDAGPDDEPTPAQLDAARDEAQAALDRIEDGDDFAEVAAEVSDDFTAATGGELGWFGSDDAAYGEYFDLVADAEAEDIVGPVEVERGYALLQAVDRREETQEGGLRDALAEEGVDEATYREYLRGELILDEYEEYFADEVIVSPTAQRRVAEIRIEPVSGTAVAQVRARHILVQPDPELEDQADASDEEWEAALEAARDVVELARADDADWFELAEEYSDEPNAGGRGGDLGWFDPASSPFVEEFTAGVASLEVGEVSDPIRTPFGWHIIEKTGERESPQAQAADLVEELRADPDRFGDVAREVSEDHASAAENGEIGWVAPYQLDHMREEAVFGLAEVGDISDLVDDASGISIYQLLEASESREIEEERLEQIRATGFERWLDSEVRSGVETWIDPQFSSSTAA
jgi:parvulin-like peptidyl-prolyl isomerase